MQANEICTDLNAWSRSLQESLRSSGAVRKGKIPRSDALSRICKSGKWSYEIKCDEKGDDYASIVGCKDETKTVHIPQAFDNLAVKEIGVRAFAGNKTVQHVTMPSTVEKVGSQAFINCSLLETLSFSPCIEALDESLLSGCSHLEEVVLPTSLRVIPRRFFASTALRNITVPSCVERIEGGAFDGIRECEIRIDPDNPFLSTDGVALYDKTGSVLLSALKAVSHYKVLDSCRIISDSAFKGMGSLREVDLGQGVKEIGAYAFFRTSLSRLICPVSLEKIGNKAFASSKLREVELNAQLEYIGEQAFACTNLGSFSMPSSLVSLGPKAFWRTNISFEDQASSLKHANDHLAITHGCLYEKKKEGLVLIEGLSNEGSCRIEPGTIEISAEAFEGDSSLESVIVPEGVVSIGDGAFRFCEKLRQIQLPDSLRQIGSEALFGTGIRGLCIGPSLERIGRNALEFAGDSRNGRKAKLDYLAVSPGNKYFYLRDGMLIAREEDGDHVLLHDGHTPHVRIPDTVIAVDDMAFYNSSVSELFVPASLKSVSQRAFLGCDGLKSVHIDYPELVNGIRGITVAFPVFSRDRWDFSRSLRMNSAGLFLDFDVYDAYAVHEPNPPRAVEMALGRLLEPVDLSESSRANYESAVLRYMEVAIASFEQERNEKAINALFVYARKSDLVRNEIVRLEAEAQSHAVREVAARLNGGR